MTDLARQDRELGLISELCRQLARLGLSVSMSDARPAAVLGFGEGDASVEITVDASGEFFEWRGSRDRYPVTDPAGAAARVVRSLRAGTAEAGEGA